MAGNTPEDRASASLQEGMGAIKANERGGGNYATSYQSGLMNRAMRGNGANRGSGGDHAGSCWGAASVTGLAGRQGHGEGGGGNIADSYCMLSCEWTHSRGFNDANRTAVVGLASSVGMQSQPEIDLLQMFDLVELR
jgi:hypothetical protein